MDNLKRKVNTSGVTLVELLVVVMILVFLMTVAIWYFRNQILKGNDAKRKGDIHRIQVAVEEYEKDNNCYPLPEIVVCDSDGLSPYMSKVPCDPMTNDSYRYEYDLENLDCPSWYRIYTNLDNLSDLDITGECGPDYAYNYYDSSPNAPDPDCVEVGSGGNGGTESDYYGCFSGVCVPIGKDPSRPAGECDPHFTVSDCRDSCINHETGQADNECTIVGD